MVKFIMGVVNLVEMNFDILIRHYLGILFYENGKVKFNGFFLNGFYDEEGYLIKMQNLNFFYSQANYFMIMDNCNTKDSFIMANMIKKVLFDKEVKKT